MTKLLIGVAAAVAMAGMSVVWTSVSAQAGSTSQLCYLGYYYSVEQPDWSKRGAPCWKPWDQNPILKFKAAKGRY